MFSGSFTCQSLPSQSYSHGKLGQTYGTRTTRCRMFLRICAMLRNALSDAQNPLHLLLIIILCAKATQTLLPPTHRNSFRTPKQHLLGASRDPPSAGHMYVMGWSRLVLERAGRCRINKISWCVGDRPRGKGGVVR